MREGPNNSGGLGPPQCAPFGQGSSDRRCTQWSTAKHTVAVISLLQQIRWAALVSATMASEDGLAQSCGGSPSKHIRTPPRLTLSCPPTCKFFNCKLQLTFISPIRLYLKSILQNVLGYVPGLHTSPIPAEIPFLFRRTDEPRMLLTPPRTRTKRARL